MNHFYTFAALDIARDRTREAQQARLASLASRSRPSRPGALRRGLATSLALVSRGTASAVRRLDGVVADDLQRSLAAE
jgi:hypothetical protein